jgi:transcriptional regulator with XRE-family HTH domain
MTHIMRKWAKLHNRHVDEIAEEAGTSNSHLINILAGRRTPSLRLAKKLSDVTHGVVPVDAFLSSDLESVSK